MTEHAQSIKVEATHHQASTHSNVMTPELTLVVLTWVTFFLLLVILKKFAWQPILTALDAREEKIRQSIEEAERIKEEFNKIDETRNEIIKKAEHTAKEIVDESRFAAKEAAKIIQGKAREESQILLENARREINDELEKAQAVLRRESAEIAVKLAGKIIDKNLTLKANQKIINRFMKDI